MLIIEFSDFSFQPLDDNTTLGDYGFYLFLIMFIIKFSYFYFQPLDDNKTLGDYGFTFATARAQAPATIGLAVRQDGRLFLFSR